MRVSKVNFSGAHFAEELCRSLTETGFAVLVNHPIQAALVSDVYFEWANFFKGSIKNQFLYKKDTQEGYFPFKSENAKGYSVKDLKEFYHIYDWSELPPGITAKTRNLFLELSRLGFELLQSIDGATPKNIRDGFSIPLKDMVDPSPRTLFRILHYPALSGAEENGAIRAAAHEDINLITLLTAATAPGLQVKDSHGNWHDVECDPGSIVINAGDMLQMASEGYYKSTTHQVVNPSGLDARTSRYSMPLFMQPRDEVMLSKKYSAKDYLFERLEEIGLKK